MENFEAAFDKAATNLQASTEQTNVPTAPQGQEEMDSVKPEVSEGQAKITQKAPENAPAKGQADQTTDETNGELPKDQKDVQRYITKLTTAKAEAERKLQEYQKHVNLQEIEQYNKWKQEQQNQVAQTPLLPVQMTAEQWNMIKDDPMKVTEYMQSIVQANLNQAAEAVGQELNQIKHTQAVAEWEKNIQDFAKEHPDMWELHEAGLFKPILEATVKAGGSLEDAYLQSVKIRDGLRQKAQAEAQTRVKQKKDASTFTGTAAADMETVVVDKKSDVFEKAFDLAYDKKGTVKSDQTVRPTSRVKYKR